MARRRTVQRAPSGRIASTYEEEEEEQKQELDGILRDGQSVRVSLFMRDGSINPDLTPTQRGKALHQTQTADAVARRYGLSDALQLHRPGFRRNTDAGALERTRQAYNDYDAADAVAYKQTGDYSEYTGDYSEYTGSEPRNTGAGAPAKGSGAPVGAYPLSAGEGTSCTINGQPGTLVRQGNWLVCQPRRSQDAATDARAEAYRAYDEEMQNAWRTRK